MSSSREGSEVDALGLMAGLWQMIHGVLDDMEPELEEQGLSAKSFFLLDSLESYPFPAELARGMHLPPPTVTYLIKQLEAAGFLERRAEPGDLRKFRLVRTEAGGSALERGRRALRRAMSERLRRVEPGDLVVLERIVKGLAGQSGGCDRP